MRVGILTFHYGRNYGALLQAYGLRRAIAALGHDAAVIHYIPEYSRMHMSPLESNWLRLGWRTYGPWLALQRRVRTYRFNRFKREELRLTRRCRDKGELVQQVGAFDAVVVGSDQVWNLNGIDSEDQCYFLDFPRPVGLRCISYAACCGRQDQPAAYLGKVSRLLAHFHAVGVRNEVTAEFVRSLADCDSTVVADPTLLIDYEEAEDGYVPDCRYILVYALEGRSFTDYARVIALLRERVRLPVWAVADGNAQWQDTPFPGAERNWFGVTPGRFLSLVKHAAFVVTDSFHGTIFAVKYHRPFVTLNDGGWRNMRMFDLANRYGIGHRIKGIDEPLDHAMLLDTEDLALIQDRFAAHARLSYEFLGKALAGEYPS